MPGNHDLYAQHAEPLCFIMELINLPARTPNPRANTMLSYRYGGHEWAGHGVGVLRSAVVYSNPFRVTRYDAEGALREQRYRLQAKASMEWIPDVDPRGLHRSVDVVGVGKSARCAW